MLNEQKKDFNIGISEFKIGVIPLSKWNLHFDYPKLGTLRQLVFKNTFNFRNEVVREIGKRQYIDVEAFKRWVEKPKNGANYS